MTYCDFKPGDVVVFIGTEGLEPADFQLKQKWLTGLLEDGRVYTIHSVLHEARWGAICGVHLMEVICPNRFGFDHRMFRKVQRRDLTAWLATETTFEEPKRLHPEPAVDALFRRIMAGGDR
ncbi:MAG: hypothetical protein DI624_01660 [Brevundimonas sp.]|uniref:hypothetical protein n=1 Tax=Brevundimonas sp. TaxID=1871086 RepID=UPI000DB171F1|nr:hypothetical protein [Brevundimonas sp.]PZU00991.1 MAG: hypothetical protein DI624_01660 [Brevundimonas sp.]